MPKKTSIFGESKRMPGLGCKLGKRFPGVKPRGFIEICFHLPGPPSSHLGLVSVTRIREPRKIGHAPIDEPLFDRDSCELPIQPHQPALGFDVCCARVESEMLCKPLGKPLFCEWVVERLLRRRARLGEPRQQTCLLQRVVTYHVFTGVELDKESLEGFLR